MSDLIHMADVCEILADMYPMDGELVIPYKEIDQAYSKVQELSAIEAVPLEPLCMWLSGYVAPPKYALDETCKCLVSKSINGTATDRAKAWEYHFKNLMECGLMKEIK